MAREKGAREKGDAAQFEIPFRPTNQARRTPTLRRSEVFNATTTETNHENHSHTKPPRARAVAMVGAAAPADDAEKKPNIVFILADNLGYGEIRCDGGGLTRGAATPRIDSLARSGLRLLNMNMEMRIELRPYCLP
ncbi:MAG: hypothetical protein HYV60_25485 [Planctomycetia bacterium]|nr:hypothetical protein [Planctomycetia bacterium]